MPDSGKDVLRTLNIGSIAAQVFPFIQVGTGSQVEDDFGGEFAEDSAKVSAVEDVALPEEVVLG